MTLPIALELSTRALTLLGRARLRPLAPKPEPGTRVLVVDVPRQTLVVLEHDWPVAAYRVSTSAVGVGGASGSNRTPPGWMRIHRAIGGDQPRGAIFESREPTGEVWSGGADARDLILTRVLTLEGLEPGVNLGPGCDSLERYIYFHGTNHERSLGTPASHGCVRLSNDDVIDLFGRVGEGDLVVVEDERADALPPPFGGGRFHYAGLAGSGMSALAQFQAMRGGRASGSDRSFDRGERAESRAQLEKLGIEIYAQDGSGLGGNCAALIVSTAVETQVPDVAAAREREVPVLHRSELLAHFVRTHRTIAVSGTSGKSTVVAMIFEILRGAGRDPSVITGGDLVVLQREGLWGNAWAGESDLLVVEADESDGSLVRYEPAIGVILNLQRDHKEMDEVAAMFDTFRRRTREGIVAGDAANLSEFAASGATFGFGARAKTRARDVALERDGSTFRVERTTFTLPVPGRHNVANALAAIAACRAAGVPLEEMVEPLSRFAGVGRRFQVLGSANGVEVIDDFAHNPAKIEAALLTAQARAERVLAVYQPHGYGPTRFLRKDFVKTFSKTMRPNDRLWMLEVFYAGGTAARDFSAADIVAEIGEAGANAAFASSRDELVGAIAAEAKAGDAVLVMGARDPSLTTLAKTLLDAVSGAGARAR